MYQSLGPPPLLPRPRPHISELPVEILDMILEHVSSEQGKPYMEAEATLAALARTSRKFYDCSMPLLYRDVVRKHPLLVYWAAQHDREGTMRGLLAAGENLMQSVGFDWRVPTRLTPDHDIQPECSSWSPGQLYRNISFRRVVCPGVTYHHVHLGHARYRGFASPIHFAVVAGHIELMELMVGHSPSIVGLESKGLQFGGDGSPLSLALDCPSRLTGDKIFRIVQILLHAGSDTHIKCGDMGMDSALHIACHRGLKDVVSLLLDQRFETNINLVNYKGAPPIWEAIFRDQCKGLPRCLYILLIANNDCGLAGAVVDLLLQRGVSIDSESDRGYTPLIAACIQGNWERAMQLVRRGANVNAQCTADLRRSDHDSGPLRPVLPEQWNTGHDFFGRRPIDICCHGRPEDQQHELNTDDLDHESSRSTEPFSSSRQDLVAMLIERGADLGPDGSKSQRPPLVVAAASQ